MIVVVAFSTVTVVTPLIAVIGLADVEIDDKSNVLNDLSELLEVI